MSTQQAASQKIRRQAVKKPGYRTFTMSVSPREQAMLTELARRMGRSRAAATRASWGRTMRLLEAEEQRKQWATVDKDGNVIIVHFVI